MSSQRKKRGRTRVDIGEAISLAIQNGLSERATIDKNIVRRPLQPKSEEAYSREMDIWKAYERKFPDSDPCDMQTMKHFAEVIGRTTKYRLDRKTKTPTTSSVRNKMRRFYNKWEREYHKTIPEHVKLSMAPYITGELADKLNLSKEKRKPTFLTISNYVHMQELLWLQDSHDYVHEGSRVDSANLLNTHCYTSARLQEVCQATYKDIICMVSWKDGEPEFKMDFKREFAKGMQDTPKKPEHPLAERIQGPDGPPPLFAQPMLHWLANFLSSQAFRDYHTVEDILALRPPTNETYWILDWAENKLNQPVFPEWSAAGPKNKAKNDSSWGYQASQWAKRAGFETGMGLHAPRREALIKVDDSGYSMGQVMKFAAHRNPRTLVGSYLDDLSTVDGAACFLGLQPRRDLTEDFRSASMRRNPNFQHVLPGKILEALQNREDHIGLTKQAESLTLQIEAAIAEEDSEQLRSQRKRVYKARTKLETKELDDYRRSQRRVFPTETPKGHGQGDWRRSSFDHIRHMVPERHRLALTLPLRAPPRSPEWISALRDLISLRTSDCRVVYQDVLRPKQGCCTVASCGQYMESVPIQDRWKHVYCCKRDSLTDQFGFAEFCFLCSQWFTSSEHWEGHCQGHIDDQNVPLRCEPITFRRAVAGAGYCLACLDKSSLPAAQRMRQFLDRPSWQRHISRCIPEFVESQKTEGSLPCLHFSCRDVLLSETEFWYHLNDLHNTPKPKMDQSEDLSSSRSVLKRKPQHRAKSGDPKKPKFVHISSTTFESSKIRTASHASVSFHDAQYDTDKDKNKYDSVSSQLPDTDVTSSLSEPADLHAYDAAQFASRGLVDFIDPELQNSSVSESSLSELTRATSPESICSIEPDGMKSVLAGPLAPSEQATDEPAPIDAEDDVWEAENLLAKWKQGKTVWYLVKWKGFEQKHNTWQKAADISPQLVQVFEGGYKGNHVGVELLAKRSIRKRNEYRVRWAGRPDKESSWLKDTEISRERIAEFEKGCSKSQGRAGNRWSRKM